MNTFDPKKRMLIRRRMAVTAFICVISTLFTVLWMSFFGSETVGDNLQKASGIFIIIIPCLVGIVMQYAFDAQRNDVSDKHTE